MLDGAAAVLTLFSILLVALVFALQCDGQCLPGCKRCQCGLFTCGFGFFNVVVSPAVAAYTAKSEWQDVLDESVNELLGGERENAALLGAVVFVGKADLR